MKMDLTEIMKGINPIKQQPIEVARQIAEYLVMELTDTDIKDVVDKFTKERVKQIIDNLVKSSKTVMPDLIRHPEIIGVTGFRLSPE